MLKKFEQLPFDMQNESVKKYYDILAKKKASLLFKRLFDIAVSLFLILLLSPVMLVLALIIKIDSKGPVFFRQVRVTTYGKQFRIFKFRTMVANAEKIGTLVTTKNDNRVTKVGAAIRKTRIDEIPQLFNILFGDMTLVGTRPEVVKYVQHYTDEMKATLLLPAGVTSEASICYKDEDKLLENSADADRTYIDEILPEKMKYNLSAIENFSFFSDIKTMFRTVFAVLKNDGDDDKEDNGKNGREE
ncbi:MAG: sugar transferase [Clostridia bacterium]|nr:sugar transferase [Clostridia bacterium]